MEEPALQPEVQPSLDQSQQTNKPPRDKFSKREIGLIIFIILAIVGVTVYAWQTDKNKKSSIDSFEECAAAGNPIMESYPEQCAANGQTFVNTSQAITLNFSIVVDENKLPESWVVDQNEPNNVIFSNDKENTAESCFVNLSITVDEKASETDATTYSSSLRNEIINGNEKGYKIDTLEEIKVIVSTSEGNKELPGYLDHWYLPGDTSANANFYQKSANIIKDGGYLNVVESCGQNDLVEADKALLAATIEM